jgi:hypothetical protein
LDVHDLISAAVSGFDRNVHRIPGVVVPRDDRERLL